MRIEQVQMKVNLLLTCGVAMYLMPRSLSTSAHQQLVTITLPSLPAVGANTETEHQNFGLASPRPAYLTPSPSRVEATCHSYPTGIPHPALPIPASRNPDSSSHPLRRHGVCLTPHSTEPPTQRPLPLPTTVANRI